MVSPTLLQCIFAAWLALASFALIAPSTASAAGPPSSTALAIEKGTLGAEALHDGRWEDAVDAFTAALPHAEASGDAALLAKIQRGLGKAHDTLEHHADALRHYRAYLALNIDEPLKRREVELRVADLERVLRAGLVVRVEAPGARITVDGEVVTSADGSVDVTPGRHVVRVTAPGHQDHEEAVQVDGGATVTLVVRMRRLGAGSGCLSPMDPKSPAVESGPGATPYVLLTVGLVVVGGGVTSFLLGDAAHGDLQGYQDDAAWNDSLNGPVSPRTREEALAKSDEGSLLKTIGVIGIGAGAGLALVGTIMALAGGDSNESEGTIHVVPGAPGAPLGFGFGGRF